jgi:hypothetical protein
VFKSIKKILLVSLLVGAAVCIGACSDDPTAPGIEPEVSNTPDNFQFQVKKVLNHTGTLEYIWSNTGAAADVDQSCEITGGGALLVINDANGTQVYSRDLAEDGSFATGDGYAGAWKIRVIFSNSSGTFNFRAQKRD